MQETWIQSLGQEDPLEKEMATHSVGVPGKSHGQMSLAGCSPQCHKRVRHDLATKQQQILYLDGAFEMFPIIYRYFSGTVTMGTKTLNSGWLTLTCIQTGSTVSSSGRLNVMWKKIGVGMERCRFPCRPGGCNSCFRGHAPHLLSASLWSPLAGEIWLGGSPLFLPDVKFYYVSLAISLIFV